MLAHPALQLAAVLTFIAPTLCVAADLPRVAPESPAWTAGSGFSFPQAKKPEKVRQSLSGIACPPPAGAARRCVAAFDEGVEARYVVIDGQTLRPEPDRIVLLPSGKELDAEGAAQDGDVIYITGSHAPKRGDCSANPDSRHVVRLTIDPSNGRSIADKASDDKGNLWRLMGGHSVLGEFVGEKTCLGASNHNLADHKPLAIDIEGLAAKDGDLYFGFRGPAKESRAFILRVAADPLFAGGDAKLQLFNFAVDEGRSIRDLLAVPEGILILEGPDDDSPPVDWRLAFWDGTATGTGPVIAITPKDLATLDLTKVTLGICDKEMKPEAIALLEDGSDFRRILVLSDGMCDGGPISFRIPK